MKQEVSNSSYYSIAWWEIPTLALYSNYFVSNAKVGSYAIIATIAHLLFHYFLPVGSLLHF